MTNGNDKRLRGYGSKKKKSNRDGKKCAEHRALRKRSRRIGKDEATFGWNELRGHRGNSYVTLCA